MAHLNRRFYSLSVHHHQHECFEPKDYLKRVVVHDVVEVKQAEDIVIAGFGLAVLAD